MAGNSMRHKWTKPNKPCVVVSRNKERQVYHLPKRCLSCEKFQRETDYHFSGASR